MAAASVTTRAAKLLTYSIKGFESYVTEQTIALHPELTYVAGRNNVGKSALLRAMYPGARQEPVARGFAAVYRWLLPRDLLERTIPESNSTARQMLAKAFARDEVIFRASFDSPPEAPVSGAGLQPGIQIGLEELGLETSRAGSGQPIWNQPAPAGNQLIGVAELQLLAIALALQVSLIGPRQIQRGPQQLRADPHLEPDARNLTSVLYHLQNNEPATGHVRLKEVLTEAFPEIETVSVHVSTDLNRSGQGEPFVTYNGRLDDPVPLASCGSGVEQILLLTAGVITARDPQVFLIDEPQTYLHPHGERSLLKLFERYPQHQYVVVTHSSLLLNARPLSQARLVTLESGESRITEFTDPDLFFKELDIRAGDLWLPDRILWVEGPTEVEIFGALIEELTPAERAGLAIRAMPGASRFAARSAKQAEATYQFCDSISQAVSPLAVTMRFLFDQDEKSPEVVEQIKTHSRGRATFLAVREAENLFLVASLLIEAIKQRCEVLAISPPEDAVVEAKFREIASLTSDRKLYPKTPAEPSLTVIRGSELLDRLYQEFTQSRYEKVTDGRALAELAMIKQPELLDPLREVLKQLD